MKFAVLGNYLVQLHSKLVLHKSVKLKLNVVEFFSLESHCGRKKKTNPCIFQTETFLDDSSIDCRKVFPLLKKIVANPAKFLVFLFTLYLISISLLIDRRSKSISFRTHFIHLVYEFDFCESIHFKTYV